MRDYLILRSQAELLAYKDERAAWYAAAFPKPAPPSGRKPWRSERRWRR